MGNTPSEPKKYFGIIHQGTVGWGHQDVFGQYPMTAKSRPLDEVHNFIRTYMKHESDTRKFRGAWIVEDRGALWNYFKIGWPSGIGRHGDPIEPLSDVDVKTRIETKLPLVETPDKFGSIRWWRPIVTKCETQPDGAWECTQCQI